MKQARMVRPRPSASVAALAPLERRGGCGTCHGATLFRPNIALDLVNPVYEEGYLGMSIVRMKKRVVVGGVLNLNC